MLSLVFARCGVHLRHSQRDPLGPLGERHAAKYLKTQGYRVLGRNVRVRAGEADIVCRDPDGTTIVIVEVKARRRRAGQPGASAVIAPEAAVHAAKRRRLAAIARSLARLNGWDRSPMRIDVVAVEWVESGSDSAPVVRHHRDAVRA